MHGKQCYSQHELDESDLEAIMETKGKLSFKIVDEGISKTGSETDLNANSLKNVNWLLNPY